MSLSRTSVMQGIDTAQIARIKAMAVAIKAKQMALAQEKQAALARAAKLLVKAPLATVPIKIRRPLPSEIRKQQETRPKPYGLKKMPLLIDPISLVEDTEPPEIPWKEKEFLGLKNPIALGVYGGGGLLLIGGTIILLTRKKKRRR